MSNVLSVEDALARILADITPLEAERVPLANAFERVLAEPLIADVNLPPFANSGMDGFAVLASDVATASAESPVNLAVVMDIPAGGTPTDVLKAGQAARIMTGAPMPDGADTVIPVEDTDSLFDARAASPAQAQVTIRRGHSAGAYVRPIGEDVQVGQTLLEPGTLLHPAEVGLCAAMGQAELLVRRQPHVVILSTGDELLEPHEPLTPGKIRDVNGYTLSGLAALYGARVTRLPIARDTLEDVRTRFRQALALKPDLILSSAGVSVGTYDVVRAVLEELGAVSFWRVNLRPGKPLAYGQLEDVPFFGLPGNPVSAMVTFDVFVRPTLLKMSGRPDAWPTAKALVTEDIDSDGRRSYLRVTLRREGGQLYATPTGTQSSGALSSMVLADGLLIVPEDVKRVLRGSELAVRLFKMV